MKLAAIDIGTNSIHMIVVDVVRRRHFEVVDRVKEMVKLGVGVFATNRLSDRAYNLGLETIERYVQLADQLGVDEIITAATSATREAQNGEAFLKEVYQRTKIRPRIISGKEEARLIFLAVRNAIALEKNEQALVLDIGGGSTEAVVGSREAVLFGTSMKLGVLRLMDMFEDKGTDQGTVGEEARGILEAHIQFLAKRAISAAKQAGFTRIIGTSGTIRTLGEAVYIRNHDTTLQSVNAEVVSLKGLEALTDELISLKPNKREKIDGISSKRVDAIHLGGILLVKLLKMAEIKEITLCDASLREGLILDYIDRHPQEVEALSIQTDLRHRKAAQLVHKYGANWESNTHIASLADQLFEQTQDIHQLGEVEKEVLEYAALLHDIGQYLSLKAYHKSSRYILKREDPRGFTDEEMLLIGHVVRYHRKSHPKTKHKQFKRLSEQQQRTVWVLAGLLRIAAELDRTKDQQIEKVSCQLVDNTLEISVAGEGDLKVGIWAARQERQVLEKALGKTISICAAS
ncbi:MAG: Ppx/GppA phosphatase family protein [Cyanobacteria bacterium J06621_11]